MTDEHERNIQDGYEDRIPRTGAQFGQAFADSSQAQDNMAEVEEFKKDPESQRAVLKQYLDSVAEMCAAVKKGPAMRLGYAIPAFFDEPSRAVEWNGVSKAPAFHLMDMLNTLPSSYIAIMAYRDKALGSNGTIQISTGEVDYAGKSASKVKVWIGQETLDVTGDRALESIDKIEKKGNTLITIKGKNIKPETIVLTPIIRPEFKTTIPAIENIWVEANEIQTRHKGLRVLMRNTDVTPDYYFIDLTHRELWYIDRVGVINSVDSVYIKVAKVNLPAKSLCKSGCNLQGLATETIHDF
ncbi:MAG: hypothetical protein EOP04_29230 [Proteobacteria bacterium]|nr:MAG: hypothetical protein EOP04_29230 [Pseudomonadota bacterium]